MDRLHWDHPELLWILSGIVPVVLLPAMRLRGRLASAIVRGLGLACCLTALAGPWIESTETLVSSSRTVLLVDHSQSVAGDAATRQRHVQRLEQKLTAGGGRLVHLRFAGEAVNADAPLSAADRTDIQRAIDRANELTADVAHCRIVLLSDGRATGGDAVLAASRIAMRGGRVDVIPIGRAEPRPPRIVRIEPTPQCRAGVAAGVLVGVDLPGGEMVTARLLASDGRVLDSSRVVGRGRQAVMLDFTPQQPGLEAYRVELLAQGGGAGGPGAPRLIDRRPVAVHVEGPPRILLADPFSGEADALAAALHPLGLPVDVITPDRWPAELSDYAAVVLSDFAGNELTDAQRRQLVDYVERGGGGLLFIGGGNTVAERWRHNMLAELLPLELQPPPKELPQKPPPVAVCYVFDRSASMGGGLGGGVSKLDMVKAAVRASLRSLPDSATVAVVVFDDEADVIVPPTAVTARDQIEDLLDHVTLGGGTNMSPAIGKGLDLLAGMRGDRHLVLLTDGDSIPPAGGDSGWSAHTSRARQQRISWTSIAVGADSDVRLMRRLAREAGGQYHFCDSDDQIPQVFIRQARAVQRKAEVRRQPFRPTAGPAAYRLRAVRVDQMPELDGQVRAQARPSADIVLRGEQSQPLLAEWQFGVGRVIAFASDAKGVWADRWLNWDRFSAFWCEQVSQILRPPSDLHLAVRSQVAGDRVSYTLSVSDPAGEPVVDLDVRINMTPWPGDGGRAAPADLARRFAVRSPYPGDNEVSINTLDLDGMWLATITGTTRDRRSVRYDALFAGTRPQEMAETGPDLAALQALADAGNGALVTDPSALTGLGVAPARTVERRRPLWPYLVAAALMLWPLDALVRRCSSPT